MVSPFADYEDPKRARWRRALGIAPDAPPERVDALLSELEARGLGEPPDGQREAVEERLGLRPSNPFERYVTHPLARFGRAAKNIMPDADPADVADMQAPGGFPDAVQAPFLSFLPRSFETGAPEPLQPAARVVRGVVSPGGIGTLGIGGARAGLASVGGSVAGATAGAPFGPVGETVGSMVGGVLPGARVAPGAMGVTRGVPVGGQVAHAATQGVPPVQPAAAAPKPVFDPYGLNDAPEPLSRLDRIQNAMREVSLEHGGPGVIADPKITPIMRGRGRIIRVGESQSDLAANEVATQVKRTGFRFDEQGRIPALAGIDPENPSGPLMSSLLARLPLYEKRLSPVQLAALRSISDTMGAFGAAAKRVGIETGTRADIIDGGSYFPRTAEISDKAIRSQVFANRRPGTGSYRKTATFDQAEEGLAAGVEYLTPEEAARGYVKSVSKDIANAHAANQIKALGVGSTPADRIDHALQLDVEKLRSSISGRIQTLARQTSRAGAEYRAAGEAAGSAQATETTLGELADLPIDRAVDELGRSMGLSRAQVNRKEIRESLYEWARAYRKDMAGASADPYAATPAGQALERARGELRVLERLDTKFGKAQGATRGKVDRVTTRAVEGLERQTSRAEQRYAATAGKATDTADTLESLRTQLEGLSGRWEKAKNLAGYTPQDSSLTTLPGLQKLALPTRMAEAIETVLNQEKPSTGGLEKTIGAARRIMQAGMTTLDNSAPGIQGLLLAYRNPKAFAVGMKANYKIWAGRPDVIRAVISDSDRVASAKGLPTAKELARYSLNLSEGGSAVYDVSIPAKIRNLPGINRAQRAFEGFGLPARLQHAYDVIGEEIATGRTLDEIKSSGDMQKLMQGANRITGIADTPFGGGPGQAVLFAARFLQARMANVANGVMGLKSFELHDVVPMLPNKLNVRVGFKTPIEQRQARKAMLRMIGVGVGLTVAANEARGKETDFRPVVNGRWNSNFIKVRDVLGRDISVFGPYDSLLRLIVGVPTGVVTGKPGESVDAARSLGAPHVALAWDVISGEDVVDNPVPKLTELRTEDIPALAGRVGESFTPISGGNVSPYVRQGVQAVQEGEIVKAAGAAGGAAFELHGGKSAPLGFTDEADRVSQKLYRKEWYGLNDSQQKYVRERMYTEAPEIMLRTAEKDFAEYELRRLNAQDVSMLRSSLKKLALSSNLRVRARARELLKKLDDAERSRKPQSGAGEWVPVGTSRYK